MAGSYDTNKLLSGIELSNDVASTLLTTTAWVSQDFMLPQTIVRGTDDDELLIPPLTGFSVMVGVAEDNVPATVIEWKFERFIPAEGWELVESGLTNGAQAEGNKLWFDIYFDRLVTVDTVMLSRACRISVRSIHNGVTPRQEVAYTNGVLYVDNVGYTYTLVKDTYQIFDGNGKTGVVYWDPDGPIEYYPAQAITGFWTGISPDLSVAAIEGGGTADPLTFRIYTASGDSGIDFFGNTYRHALFDHAVSNVSTLNGAIENKHWMSKPNPSKFGVERQYFNLAGAGPAAVVDSVLVDPITPNVFFNIYYTDEGAPGTTTDDWDNKLWERVPRVFKADVRKTHKLPAPIRAKYIKIEYTHLQPKDYNPGDFQQPIRYQKFPKWVVDHFISELEARKVSEDQFVHRTVKVEYDALRLAYEHYLGDLDSSLDSESPITSEPSVVASDTLRKIRLDDLFQGSSTSYSDSILSNTVSPKGSLERPAEQRITQPLGVSSLNRDKLVEELSYPVLFFYLKARHRYREVQATFQHHRAYFVGIREIAFLRDNYARATDTTNYIEMGGDNVNLERNDFVHNNTALVISDG